MVRPDPSVCSRALGGGHPTLVDVSQKFWTLVDVFFSQNRYFFRNFQDVYTNNNPKITFYCILIYKLPKNFEKRAWFFLISRKCSKIFCSAFGATKNTFFFNFLPPPLWQMDPLPSGLNPPPHLALVCSIQYSKILKSIWKNSETNKLQKFLVFFEFI